MSLPRPDLSGRGNLYFPLCHSHETCPRPDREMESQLPANFPHFYPFNYLFYCNIYKAHVNYNSLL